MIVNSSTHSITDGYNLIKVLIEDKAKAKFCILVNQVSNVEHAQNIFNRILATCKKYLKMTPIYLGNINSSNNMRLACDQQKIFMKDYHATHVGKQIQEIGDKIWEVM